MNYTQRKRRLMISNDSLIPATARTGMCTACAVAAALLMSMPGSVAAQDNDIELQPVEGGEQQPAGQDQPTDPAMTTADTTFEIGSFTVRYRVDHPQHIAVSEIMTLPMHGKTPL